MDPRIPDFRAVLDKRPVSRFQIRLLALAILLLMTDGYDTQAIGYVAPTLTAVWQVPRASFGPVFSAGLVGLMLGAMIFTPIADRYGPRRVLLACTAGYGLLTLATAFAPSREVLLVLRFLTGLGLGGAMPNAIALVSEYSPTRVRTLMGAAAVCGFSLGGLLVARSRQPSWRILGGSPCSSSAGSSRFSPSHFSLAGCPNLCPDCLRTRRRKRACTQSWRRSPQAGPRRLPVASSWAAGSRHSHFAYCSRKATPHRPC